jgi:predicted CXXCH cytochrome family protein
VVVAAFVLPAITSAQGIAQSAHNLSVSGPGGIRAQSETDICIFCHASHVSRGTVGMWNRRASAATYTPYSSSTAIAQPGQPTGSSVLCLSCHDGTIALGEAINRANAIVMSGGASAIPPGRARTGTDLRFHHPISFQYTASLAAQNDELAMPGTFDSRLKLDGNGELQCTTCHTAHDNTYGAFLVKPNIGSQMCTECHQKNGWFQTSHSLSAATAVSGGPRLLRYEKEENNCSACHNGRVASKDVMAAIDQFSSHQVKATTLVHDPTEPAVVDSRHVECSDCHNAHATQSARVIGDVPANVRGVNLAGAEVRPAIETFQICLRCHGDSPNQPPARTPRQITQANMRLKIQPNNPSFHPIAAPGQNPSVPSLINPLTEQSIIGCGGCHNSSTAASAGGSGPEGPHGSSFAPILVRNYVTIDNTPESAANYALCYNCHSRNSILNDDSFKEHDKHIRGEDTPCNACHDPHGISATQGNPTNNSHLINFDTSIVFPRGNGELRFEDRGQFSGSCYLVCHGEDHDNFDY